jgi:hypothetical protein
MKPIFGQDGKKWQMTINLQNNWYADLLASAFLQSGIGDKYTEARVAFK